MKNTLLSFLLLGIASVILAQTNCYDFEGTISASNDKSHAFNVFGNGNSGFLQDWKVTSGTPSVYGNGDVSGVNAFAGNQYALFAVCDAGATSSEGASVDYNFAQGQSYTVSMAIRNAPLAPNAPTPVDVEYVLLQTPISYSYNANTGCSSTPALPGNAVVAHTVSNLSQNSWQTVSFNVSNLAANYTQLWIRAKFSSGSQLVTTFLCIDSMCIQPAASSECYMFEEPSIVTADKHHAFNVYGNGNAGFLEDWRVVSGTPSVYTSGDIAGINAFEGNQYALFAVCDASATSSESASLDFNFNQAKSYTVSMAVRNAPLPPNSPTPIDVEYVLLQAPISYSYNSNTGCSSTPTVPGNGVVIHKITNLSQNAWQTISFNVGGLSANYTQLWIRAKFSAGSPLVTTILCVDSFCISEDLSTGITNLNGNIVAVTAAPNPFKDATLISVDGTAGIQQLELTDINGRLIKKFSVNGSHTLEIQREGMVPGLYFYALSTTDNKRAFGKLIVQ